MEWCIIQLRDRQETPLWEEDDFSDGFIYYGYETRKEAEKQAKFWRGQDKFDAYIFALAGEKFKRYRYIVERVDRI